jgi:uncharacterized protein YkwD
MKMHRFVPAVILTGLAALAIAPPASASTGPTPQWELYLAINRARAAHGLPKVFIASGLRTAAQRHADGMVTGNYFAHTSPFGQTLYDRIVASGFIRIGYWWAGETLAWGTPGIGAPANVVRMWLNSPEHRAILLSRNATCVGIGRALGPHFLGSENATVWTADFGHH